MGKTNSKETKAAVREYLSSLNNLTILEMKQKFLNEKGWEIPKLGMQNACINWLKGLRIPCEFVTVKTIELLAEWLDDTFDNQWLQYEKYGDDLYWLLLAREILASK